MGRVGVDRSFGSLRRGLHGHRGDLVGGQVDNAVAQAGEVRTLRERFAVIDEFAGTQVDLPNPIAARDQRLKGLSQSRTTQIKMRSSEIADAGGR